MTISTMLILIIFKPTPLLYILKRISPHHLWSSSNARFHKSTSHAFPLQHRTFKSIKRWEAPVTWIYLQYKEFIKFIFGKPEGRWWAQIVHSGTSAPQCSTVSGPGKDSAFINMCFYRIQLTGLNLLGLEASLKRPNPSSSPSSSSSSSSSLSRWPVDEDWMTRLHSIQ